MAAGGRSAIDLRALHTQSISKTRSGNLEVLNESRGKWRRMWVHVNGDTLTIKTVNKKKTDGSPGLLSFSFTGR